MKERKSLCVLLLAPVDSLWSLVALTGMHTADLGKLQKCDARSPPPLLMHNDTWIDYCVQLLCMGKGQHEQWRR